VVQFVREAGSEKGANRRNGEHGPVPFELSLMRLSNPSIPQPRITGEVDQMADSLHNVSVSRMRLAGLVWSKAREPEETSGGDNPGIGLGSVDDGDARRISDRQSRVI
jgi:hypothetical protein